MKIKKLITLIFLLGLTIAPVSAIEESQSIKDRNISLEQLKNETNNAYTNDVHSVFSLKDCINVAILNNPDIRSSLYNEEAYKSKIGQAWSNYFPVLSAGVQISRNDNNYSRTNIYRNTHSTMGYVPSISADMHIFDFGKTKYWQFS